MDSIVKKGMGPRPNTHRPGTYRKMPTHAAQATSTRKPDAMLHEHIMTRLNNTGRTEMMESYPSLAKSPNIHELSSEERLSLPSDQEYTY
jgi:hypothetical protein